MGEAQHDTGVSGCRHRMRGAAWGDERSFGMSRAGMARPSCGGDLRATEAGGRRQRATRQGGVETHRLGNRSRAGRQSMRSPRSDTALQPTFDTVDGPPPRVSAAHRIAFGGGRRGGRALRRSMSPPSGAATSELRRPCGAPFGRNLRRRDSGMRSEPSGALGPRVGKPKRATGTSCWRQHGVTTDSLLEERLEVPRDLTQVS